MDGSKLPENFIEIDNVRISSILKKTVQVHAALKNSKSSSPYDLKRVGID